MSTEQSAEIIHDVYSAFPRNSTPGDRDEVTLTSEWTPTSSSSSTASPVRHHVKQAAPTPPGAPGGDDMAAGNAPGTSSSNITPGAYAQPPFPPFPYNTQQQQQQQLQGQDAPSPQQQQQQHYMDIVDVSRENGYAPLGGGGGLRSASPSPSPVPSIEDYSDAFSFGGGEIVAPVPVNSAGGLVAPVPVGLMPGQSGWIGDGEIGSQAVFDPYQTFNSYQNGYMTPPPGAMAPAFYGPAPTSSENCDCASCVSFFAHQREQQAQMRRFHEIAEMRRKAVSAFEEYYQSPVCERPRRITFSKDMQVCAFDLDEEPAQVAVTPRSRENVCLLSPQSGLEAHRQKMRMQKAFEDQQRETPSPPMPTVPLPPMLSVAGDAATDDDATKADAEAGGNGDRAPPVIPPKPAGGRMALPPPPPRFKATPSPTPSVAATAEHDEEEDAQGSHVASSDGGMDSDSSLEAGDHSAESARMLMLSPPGGDRVVPVVGMKNSPHKQKPSASAPIAVKYVDERDEREEEMTGQPGGYPGGMTKDEEDDLNALCISYNEEHDSASSPELPHSILEMQQEFRQRQQQQQQHVQFLVPPSDVERVLSPATSTDGDTDDTDQTGGSTRPATPSTCGSDGALKSATPSPPSSSLPTPTHAERGNDIAQAKMKVAQVLENHVVRGGGIGFCFPPSANTHADEQEGEGSETEAERSMRPSPESSPRVSMRPSTPPRRPVVVGITRAEIEEQQRELCRELQGLTEMFSVATPVHAPVSSHPNVAPSELFLRLDDDAEEEDTECEEEGEEDTESGYEITHDEYAAEEEDVEATHVHEPQAPAHDAMPSAFSQYPATQTPEPQHQQELDYSPAYSYLSQHTLRPATPSSVVPRPATPSSVGSDRSASPSIGSVCSTPGAESRPVCPASPSVDGHRDAPSDQTWTVRPASPSVESDNTRNSPAAEIEAKFIRPETDTESEGGETSSTGGAGEHLTSADSATFARSTSPAPASPVVTAKEIMESLESSALRRKRAATPSPLCAATNFGDDAQMSFGDHSSGYSDGESASVIFGEDFQPEAEQSKKNRRGFFSRIGGSIRLIGARALSFGGGASDSGSMRLIRSAPTPKSKKPLALSRCSTIASIDVDFTTSSMSRGGSGCPTLPLRSASMMLSGLTRGNSTVRRSRTKSVKEIDWNYDPDAQVEGEQEASDEVRHGAVPLAGLATETGSQRLSKRTPATVPEGEETASASAGVGAAAKKSPRSLTRRVSHGFVKKVWRRKQYLADKRAKVEQQEEEERAARQRRGVQLFSNESIEMIRTRRSATLPSRRSNLGTMFAAAEMSTVPEGETSLTEKEFSQCSSRSSLRSHNSAASPARRRRPMSPRLDAGEYHSDGRRIYSWGALSRTALPEGVHWNEKEMHLSHDEFRQIFRMRREEFAHLHKWRQVQLKKQFGLW